MLRTEYPRWLGRRRKYFGMLSEYATYQVAALILNQYYGYMGTSCLCGAGNFGQASWQAVSIGSKASIFYHKGTESRTSFRSYRFLFLLRHASGRFST